MGKRVQSRSLKRVVGHEWERGYFCAVATLIRMNGDIADTVARDLFGAGGKPDNADECDRALFRKAGLMPNCWSTVTAPGGGFLLHPQPHCGLMPER